FQGVDQQHGDGHGADAAGHGRNRTGHFTRAFEVDVADQAAVGEAVNTHVDHDSAGLDHVSRDHAGFAGGYYENIGAAGLGAEIACFGIADGDSRAGGQ